MPSCERLLPRADTLDTSTTMEHMVTVRSVNLSRSEVGVRSRHRSGTIGTHSRKLVKSTQLVRSRCSLDRSGTIGKMVSKEIGVEVDSTRRFGKMLPATISFLLLMFVMVCHTASFTLVIGLTVGLTVCQYKRISNQALKIDLLILHCENVLSKIQSIMARSTARCQIYVVVGD